MSPLTQSPMRSFFALMIFATGATLTFKINLLWPYVYPITSWALMCAGATLGLVVVKSKVFGWAQTIITTMIMATMMAWAGFGLFEIWHLAVTVIKNIGIWRLAGASPLASLQAGQRMIQSLTLAQTRAYATCAAIGLPPVFFGLGKLLLMIKGSGSRISKHGPWSSKWMRGKELRYLKRVKLGIPLGLSSGSLLRYAPSKGWRAGHHAVIAGTRAGKGVSAVIPAVIDHDGPVVVLDVKGENFAVTRRWRESLSRQVIVLNPFGIIEQAKDGFNPLDYIRPNFLTRDIDVIADGLVRPEQGVGLHFSDLARQIVAAAIEVVVTMNPALDRNLNAVADILLAAGLEERLTLWVNDPSTFGRRPSQAAATLLAAGQNERGGVQTTIKKSFEWARSDEMRAFLSSSNVDLDQLLDDKIDVFIVVPLDQLEAQAVFMRLLVNIVLGTVVRQDGKRLVKKRILLVLDEFVRLGRMEKLLSIANEAAGAGIEALFVTQDKGQIEMVYGKGDTDSLLGSCVTLRIFGLGRAESNTAEWAARALGDQTVLTHSTQASQKLGERARLTTAEHRQKLMTADQILEMPAEQMLCLIGSKPPLLLTGIVSHEHAAYSKKLDRNPTRRV